MKFFILSFSMHLDVLWLDKFELFLVRISLLISVQTPLVGSKILQLKIFWV